MSFDSTAASSEAPSQEESQRDQVFLTETRVPNKQMPFPQMRGIIQLHGHWFPPGKRYSKVEKDKRWKEYKAKIRREYGRVIRGKPQSEKALVQRYSNPVFSCMSPPNIHQITMCISVFAAQVPQIQACVHTDHLIQIFRH